MPDLQTPKLATGVGAKPATPSNPAPKVSAFAPPAQTVKGDGKSYDVGGHNDTYSPTSAADPAFKQRVRSMVTDGTMQGADTGSQTGDFANGVKTVLGGASARRAAVDKAVQEATQ